MTKKASSQSKESLMNKNTSTDANYDENEIDGLDTPETTSGYEDYPLDSVFVRREDRTVAEVVGRIKKGRYILDPEFQRDFVWNHDKQSKLIESCLMRIPLPVFYVAEDKDGKIIIVDGLQRLTTLHHYLDGKFDLSLGNDAYKNKCFQDLTIALQERIEDTQLIFYILDSKAPERARLDIFDRVNSGVPLSRQQMRNCLYSGPATKWLKEASICQEFLSATGNSLDKKTMRDREVINRFCAFRLLGHKEYKSADMDDFMGRSLSKMNSMTTSELTQLMQDFKNAMNINKELFGDHAFRKSLLEDDPRARRKPINISLFDVFSTLLSSITPNISAAAKNKIKKSIINLVDDEDFSYAITHSTNSTKQVQDRFNFATAKLRGWV